MSKTLSPSSKHFIEQVSKDYEYGYFITFVKKQYSNHKVTLKEVKRKIRNIIGNHNIEFFIYKVKNIGDPDHYHTIHYHCAVFSNKESFTSMSVLKRTNKLSKTTINIKDIYFIPGLLGYISDKHKILKVFTNNTFLKSKYKTIINLIKYSNTFNMIDVVIKIKRSKRYVPI